MQMHYLLYQCIILFHLKKITHSVDRTLFSETGSEKWLKTKSIGILRGRSGINSRKSCSYIRECIERRLSCKRRCILGSGEMQSTSVRGHRKYSLRLFDEFSYGKFIVPLKKYAFASVAMLYDYHIFVTAYRSVKLCFIFLVNKIYTYIICISIVTLEDINKKMNVIMRILIYIILWKKNNLFVYAFFYEVFQKMYEEI